MAIVFPPRIATADAALETHPETVRRLVPDTCPGARSTALLAYALVVIAFVVASVVALTLAPASSSTITSPDATTFGVGSFSSFTVTASGSPAPRLSEFGPLPAGVAFTDDGNGTATLSGRPDPGTAGRYEIQIRAANGIAPDAVQNVVVRVTGAGTGPRTRPAGGTAPGAFTSAPAATASRGAPFTFTVTASGSPPPRLKLVGRVPRGVVLHDNGDGTATLSGTPRNRHPVVDHFRLKAVFGTGTARQVAFQLFTLTVG